MSFTNLVANKHASCLVAIILANLDGYCIDDDIYEEVAYNETVELVDDYLDEHYIRVDNNNRPIEADEVVYAACARLDGWAVDDDLPARLIASARKFVAREIYGD